MLTAAQAGDNNPLFDKQEAGKLPIPDHGSLPEWSGWLYDLYE